MVRPCSISGPLGWRAKFPVSEGLVVAALQSDEVHSRGVPAPLQSHRSVHYDAEGRWTCRCGKVFQRVRNGCNVRTHLKGCTGTHRNFELRRLRPAVQSALRVGRLWRYRELALLKGARGLHPGVLRKALTGGELWSVADAVAGGSSLSPGVCSHPGVGPKCRTLRGRRLARGVPRSVISGLFSPCLGPGRAPEQSGGMGLDTRGAHPLPEEPLKTCICMSGRQRCVGQSCVGPPYFAKACFAGGLS
eukprot:TRINITY_DN19888_c0_g1_i1.p2 TRINITY_DN19888_c0_g1~~TRINITY_DN19888_c0_g1_i1.p2  ORF type:complete len:247 (+),score=40.76 TRINITY_DN19888_c0_g1_i1:95-835(+)